MEKLGKTEYFSGERSVDLPALIDVVSTIVLGRDPSFLLSIIDRSPKGKREASTRLFEKWFRAFFEEGESGSVLVEYDEKTGKVVTPPFRREVFVSFRDLTEMLHMIPFD